MLGLIERLQQRVKITYNCLCRHIHISLKECMLRIIRLHSYFDPLSDLVIEFKPALFFVARRTFVTFNRRILYRDILKLREAVFSIKLKFHNFTRIVVETFSCYKLEPNRIVIKRFPRYYYFSCAPTNHLVGRRPFWISLCCFNLESDCTRLAGWFLFFFA